MSPNIRMTFETFHRLCQYDTGICIKCHRLKDGVNADDDGVRCTGCDCRSVVGIELALISGQLELVERPIQANVDDAGPIKLRAKPISRSRP